ncbi:MAG: peptidase T [Clostridioides sp.]|jgi:tripeptide aminopeptidase|nr:peptidase T [Clostridioides sp.]
MESKLVERFLKYVSFETTSDDTCENCPSSEKQRVLANYIVEELKGLGLEDANVDEHSYVMATLKGNVEGVDPIGFIAHLDTALDVSGANIKPRIIENYDGEDIVLNEELNVVTSVSDFPVMKKLKGEDIIVTDGTTLLGADDKAGIAEIITAVEYLINHPEVKHGDIKLGFNPDEEIGRGPHKFDVERFGAKYGYTLDGAEEGELQYENFNAGSATITIHGKNVHPGSAKNIMVNSQLIAAELSSMFPADERPDTTEGYEGFYHLNSMSGNVENTVMNYIIRDHDMAKFEARKEFVKEVVAKMNEKYNGRIEVEMSDQYYNMKEKVEPVMFMIDIAREAMEESDIVPMIVPIRGGTDGAQLSFKNLPCPNIFTGGMNYHGKNELVSINGMNKAVDVIIKIAQKFAER